MRRAPRERPHLSSNAACAREPLGAFCSVAVPVWVSRVFLRARVGVAGRPAGAAPRSSSAQRSCLDPVASLILPSRLV